MKKVIITLCLMISILCNSLTICAEEKPDYLIMVNRAANCVTVYGQDIYGEFSVPVIAFTCSTGRNNKTDEGTFSTTNQYRWRKMDGGVYTQYATRFHGGQLFHSVPYYVQKLNRLEWDQFNKLGDQASAGCVRLACIDSKWIYDNCKPGTQVIVYDDAENPGPLGKPASVKIPADSPYKNWDPTDPSPNNPWVNIQPKLQLVANTMNGVLYLPVGSSLDDIRLSIGMFSADGIPYFPGTYDLEIYGCYDLDTVGTYELTVRGFDMAAGLRADQTFTLVVNPPVEASESILLQ